MKTITTTTISAPNGTATITVTNGDGYPVFFGPYRDSTAEIIAKDHEDLFIAAFRFPGGIGSASFRDIIDQLAKDMGGQKVDPSDASPHPATDGTDTHYLIRH